MIGEKEDTPELPTGWIDDIEKEIKEEKEVTESDKLKDFFFPQQRNMGACSCGVKYGSSDRHSTWCPIHREE